MLRARPAPHRERSMLCSMNSRLLQPPPRPPALRGPPQPSVHRHRKARRPFGPYRHRLRSRHTVDEKGEPTRLNVAWLAGHECVRHPRWRLHRHLQRHQNVREFIADPTPNINARQKPRKPTAPREPNQSHMSVSDVPNISVNDSEHHIAVQRNQTPQISAQARIDRLTASTRTAPPGRR